VTKKESEKLNGMCKKFAFKYLIEPSHW